VLRYRPEPYYGTHVMLHVRDARAGREFLRRLIPHVDSAAGSWQAGEPWMAVAMTYSGLAALGAPEDALQSFPEPFRVGMAARADTLLDVGDNDPRHRDAEFAGGLIHIGVSVFSGSVDTWRRTMESARRHSRADAGRPGARRGPAAKQRLHLCRRPERPPGAAGLAHAADEPARHQDGAARRREPPPPHPAQHDLRRALALFTIPHEPVRRRIHGIETFNVLRGGEYFLMPSLSALRWLGNLEER
jgi:hypothetical protein